LRPRHLRAAAHYVGRRLALPVLRRRVGRLARQTPPQPVVIPLAVLTPHAAAVPSEQPAWRD